MANTFSQMYAHLIFSPKGRQNLILPSFEESLFKYLTGIVQNKGQRMIAINGMPGHIHIFIGFKPSLAIKEHHKKQSFREEYLALLKKLDIPFEERYLFEFYH